MISINVTRAAPALSVVQKTVRDTAASDAGDNSAPINVLLEVNTSGEAAKHGLHPGEVEPLLETAGGLRRVVIRGLMTMAALDGGPAVAARNFAMLRKLRDELNRKAPHGIALRDLSMGMSGDFEVAIQEGATFVRVGSLLWQD